MSNCCDNLEYAYIINNFDDELTNNITIHKYLENEKLQNEIMNKTKFLVCKNKHKLINLLVTLMLNAS
jgi:hypothetical protein